MHLYLPIAEIALSLPALVAIGLSVGFLSGLFGIGGGFIMTPMLIFMGVPPVIAVGTGTAQVIASSASGALGHWRRGNVDTKIGLLLIIGGLVGAATGVQLQQLLRALGQLETAIAVIYVVMLSTIGGLMLVETMTTLRRQAKPGPAVSMRRGSHHSALQRLPWKMRFPRSKIYMSALPPLAIGLGVGWLTAIMGIGGGFVLIPALIYLLKLPTRLGIGTSSFQIIFVSAFATVLQSWTNQSVDLMLAAPLMLGGVVGAQWGVRLGADLQVEKLRLLLALLVLAVAVRMAIDVVSTPQDLFVIQTLQT
jgi:hypothetical protein